jgi:predicted Holliday junction resolvase-like endonuclease
MKTILLTFLITLTFTACQEGSSTPSITLLNSTKEHKQEIDKKLHDKELERKNKFEVQKLNAKTKIEIAKIESTSKLEIAKIDSATKKDVANTDATTTIAKSKIESLTKKEDIAYKLYITLAIIFVVLIALVLLYFNNKRNRELKNKLHKEQLEHELRVREREHEERRLQKMLDLVGEGKLAPHLEEQVVLTLTNGSKPKKDEEVTLIEVETTTQHKEKHTQF